MAQTDMCMSCYNCLKSPTIVYSRAHVLFTLFVGFLAYSGIQHILCCVLFFFVLCTVCCQFLWIVHF